MPRILLITNSYPSVNSTEKNFVHEEVNCFIKAGLSVTVMPYYFNDVVDSEFRGELLTDLSKRNVLSFIFSALRMIFRNTFWCEFFSNLSLILTSLRRLKNFLRVSLKSELVLRALKKVKCDEYDVLYTYWCVGECVAVIKFFNNRESDVIKISRMHGFDINEDRDFNAGYIPYRRLVLPALDKIILLSIQAKSYLASKYPYVLEKSVVSPLGVNTLFNISKITWTENCVNFFSCSYPSPVKRLDVIHNVITDFARLHPEKLVSWCHFGCEINDVVFSEFEIPHNLKVIFRGRVNRSVFMKEYISVPTPVFINMSDSEGQPVSIMEAMSCSLPIVATDVGGVSEVVGSETGVLVEEGECISSIITRISNIVNDEQNYLRASRTSLLRQSKAYDVQKNHCSLASQIQSWCD